MTLFIRNAKEILQLGSFEVLKVIKCSQKLSRAATSKNVIKKF